MQAHTQYKVRKADNAHDLIRRITPAQNICGLCHFPADLFTDLHIIRRLHGQENKRPVIFFRHRIAELCKPANKLAHALPVAHRNHHHRLIHRHSLRRQQFSCLLRRNAVHRKHRVSRHKAFLRVHTHGKQFFVGIFLPQCNKVRPIDNLLHQPAVPPAGNRADSVGVKHDLFAHELRRHRNGKVIHQRTRACAVLQKRAAARKQYITFADSPQNVPHAETVYGFYAVFLLGFLRPVGKHCDMDVFTQFLYVFVHGKHNCLIACVIEAVIAAHHHVVLRCVAFLPGSVIRLHTIRRHFADGIIFKYNLPAIFPCLPPLLRRHFMERIRYITEQQFFAGHLTAPAAKIVFLCRFQLVRRKNTNIAFVSGNYNCLFRRHSLQSGTAHAHKHVSHRDKFVDICPPSCHGNAFPSDFGVGGAALFQHFVIYIAAAHNQHTQPRYFRRKPGCKRNQLSRDQRAAFVHTADVNKRRFAFLQSEFPANPAPVRIR